ncbi:ribosomal protein S18-alanine N-acetyltransferase [Alteromonas sp. C1M14]|uniref:ribosomal protein S18-alanine N-acetyltransferase n=1 Tax=Alteromonas sp. C1M14 TaxID=2841567 RepID=UPI001C09CC57|nr:ribosomal protein S18-alanine N-acetyltransferase [Alteromonas sp. C1M14]MBU2978043.1 ribosomal protein S18-alanine N-acetyltransferase [Alteromonas sp. C1M14]
MTMTIRPLVDADLNHVYGLHQQATFQPWSFSTFADCCKPPYQCLVAVLDSQVVGYGIILHVAGEVTLMDIAVAADHRGNGIGKYLLNEVIDTSIKLKADEIWLEVRAGNHAAIAMYRNADFNDIDIRRDYYPSKKGREDAIMMSKRLD